MTISNTRIQLSHSVLILSLERSYICVCGPDKPKVLETYALETAETDFTPNPFFAKGMS